MFDEQRDTVKMELILRYSRLCSWSASQLGHPVMSR